MNPAAAGAVYKPVACTECHPNNTSNAHSNNVVNVTFATATGANLGGFAPTFVQGNGTTTQTTCATYCHGSSLNATTTRGSVASWTWNGAAPPTAAAATSRLPTPPTTTTPRRSPPAPSCHGGTVNAAGVVNVAGGLHVNGAIDTSTLTCTTCHGSDARRHRPAGPERRRRAQRHRRSRHLRHHRDPPPAASASTPPTSSAPGPVRCSATPATSSPRAQVHKTGVATTGTVALANLSTTGGIATASYATTAGTCSNTYCHGNLGGGVGATNVTPTWTTAATLVCASCHGMPPSTTSTGRFHPNRTDCGACHTGYTGVAVNVATHVNGVVEYTTQTCTTCHGDPARTGTDANAVAFSSSPPVDATSLSTGAKVGAHAKHLFTGAAGGPSFSKQVACSECHNAAIPATPLHANGQPNIAFGTLARTGTGTPPGPLLRGQHLLQHLLPRQLHERRRRERHHLDRRGHDLHLLPRHASGRHPPGRLHARHLRQLPRQLQQRHPVHHQPGGARRRRGRPLQHVLHLLPRHDAAGVPASPVRT